MKGRWGVWARAARRRREAIGYWFLVAMSLRSERGVCTRFGLRLGGGFDEGGGGGCCEVV